MSRPHRKTRRWLLITAALGCGVLAFAIVHRSGHAAAVATAPPVVAAPQALKPFSDDAPEPKVVIESPNLLETELPPTTRPAISLAQYAAPTTLPSTRPDSGRIVLAAATLDPSAGNRVLDDAQSVMSNGNLLDARSRLNSAWQSGQLDANRAAAAKSLMARINQTLVFGHERFNDDPYGGTYVVRNHDTLTKIAQQFDTTGEIIGRINGIEPRRLRLGATIKVIQGPFFAVVQKSNFVMDIYLGGLPGERSSMYVTSFPVGLGREDSTPTGVWIVEPHHKLRHPTYYSPRGEGVIGANDPKNPLGGYWIGLSGTDGQAIGKLSYGIHGTIDPDSIGRQSSMGCIRLRPDDIALVYDLLVEGKSLVVVKP